MLAFLIPLAPVLQYSAMSVAHVVTLDVAL